MSRRAPNPAADRAAQNQQTIKTLLKLEANKSCADCKRNKRMWAMRSSPEDYPTDHVRSAMGKLESGDLRLHTVCLSHSKPWTAA